MNTPACSPLSIAVMFQTFSLSFYMLSQVSLSMQSADIISMGGGKQGSEGLPVTRTSTLEHSVSIYIPFGLLHLLDTADFSAISTYSVWKLHESTMPKSYRFSMLLLCNT